MWTWLATCMPVSSVDQFIAMCIVCAGTWCAAFDLLLLLARQWVAIASGLQLYFKWQWIASVLQLAIDRQWIAIASGSHFPLDCWWVAIASGLQVVCKWIAIAS